MDSSDSPQVLRISYWGIMSHMRYQGTSLHIALILQTGKAVGEKEVVMQGWITPRECEEQFPGWLAERAKSGLGWAINEQPVLDPITSRFGGFEIRIMLKPDGMPDHDKGVYLEAKNQNTVVFGRRNGGPVLIGCTEEARAFADMPEGGPADPPMRFLQPVVMGFFEKVLGSDAKTFKERLESGDEASIREALEEMGVAEVKSLKPMGVVWPNATNTATVTHLYEMEVDIDRVIENPEGREWTINNCVWLPVTEVMKRIGDGFYEGVNCRMGQANTAFFTWLCRHPDALTY